MDAQCLDRRARLLAFVRELQAELILLGYSPTEVARMSRAEDLFERWRALDAAKRRAVRDLMGPPGRCR